MFFYLVLIGIKTLSCFQNIIEKNICTYRADALFEATIFGKPVNFSQIRLNQCGPYYSNSNENEYFCSGVFAVFRLGFYLS